MEEEEEEKEVAQSHYSCSFDFYFSLVFCSSFSSSSKDLFFATKVSSQLENLQSSQPLKKDALGTGWCPPIFFRQIKRLMKVTSFKIRQTRPIATLTVKNVTSR